MPLLRRCVTFIDRINRFIGQAVAWLMLVAIVVSAGNAVIRKVFDLSSNAWLDLQWMLFGAVFLLCAPWTLMRNEHVRIDVIYSILSPRKRRAINIVGHLFFLLPFTVVVLIVAWPFALTSFAQNEQSMNSGGLPVWPAKLLVPIGFGFLFLQGISELIKAVRAKGDVDSSDPDIAGAPSKRGTVEETAP